MFKDVYTPPHSLTSDSMLFMSNSGFSSEVRRCGESLKTPKMRFLIRYPSPVKQEV